MDCDRFREWMESENAPASEMMPGDVSAHAEGCLECSTLLSEEFFWAKVFGAAPEVAPAPSFKAAVIGQIRTQEIMARIEAEEGERSTLGFGLFELGAKLVPALAVVLLLFGGVASWRDMLYTPPDPDVTAFMNFVEGIGERNGSFERGASR